MTGSRSRNDDQGTFWDQQAGPKWVRHADGMDALLAPVLEAVLDRAALSDSEHVIDIGCGSGVSTLQAAEAVRASGSVLGVDISNTLLTLARQRAKAVDLSHASFVLGDAQTHGFMEAQSDAVVSRFGVMFFDDPVAAFANMARALRPGGRMVFAAWGQVPENPYFTLPAAVVREVFGGAPPRGDLDAPGPFAFRDPARVLGILADAGLSEAQVDVQNMDLIAPDGAESLTAQCAEIGPLERAFEHFEATAAQRQEAFDKVTQGFEGYARNGKVHVPAQINICTAIRR